MNVFIIRDNCSIDQDDQNFNLIFVFFFYVFSLNSCLLLYVFYTNFILIKRNQNKCHFIYIFNYYFLIVLFNY